MTDIYLHVMCAHLPPIIIHAPTTSMSGGNALSSSGVASEGESIGWLIGSFAPEFMHMRAFSQIQKTPMWPQ